MLSQHTGCWDGRSLAMYSTQHCVQQDLHNTNAARCIDSKQKRPRKYFQIRYTGHDFVENFFFKN